MFAVTNKEAHAAKIESVMSEFLPNVERRSLSCGFF